MINRATSVGRVYNREMIHIYIVVIGALAFLVSIIFIKLFRPKKAIIGLSEHGSKELIDFLEKADDAYILTHETIEISYFSKYASNAVCNEILEAIYKNPAKLFGTKNYRTRTWSIVEQEQDVIVLRKEIFHRNIEVKKGIHIALGDEIIEEWRISLGPNGFLIVQIS
jgi:hypothetical protein